MPLVNHRLQERQQKIKSFPETFVMSCNRLIHVEVLGHHCRYFVLGLDMQVFYSLKETGTRKHSVPKRKMKLLQAWYMVLLKNTSISPLFLVIIVSDC